MALINAGVFGGVILAADLLLSWGGAARKVGVTPTRRGLRSLATTSQESSALDGSELMVIPAQIRTGFVRPE